MSLRDELAEPMQQTEADLRQKAEAAGVADKVLEGPAGFWIVQVILPMLGAQQDAILRLADEIDQLRAS
jgi:hypothetical protein